MSEINSSPLLAFACCRLLLLDSFQMLGHISSCQESTQKVRACKSANVGAVYKGKVAVRYRQETLCLSVQAMARTGNKDKLTTTQ